MDRVGSMSDEEAGVEFQDSAGAEAFAAGPLSPEACYSSPCYRMTLEGIEGPLTLSPTASPAYLI